MEDRNANTILRDLIQAEQSWATAKETSFQANEAVLQAQHNEREANTRVKTLRQELTAWAHDEASHS